jgi:hypothetical protein
VAHRNPVVVGVMAILGGAVVILAGAIMILVGAIKIPIGAIKMLVGALVRRGTHGPAFRGLTTPQSTQEPRT